MSETVGDQSKLEQLAESILDTVLLRNSLHKQLTIYKLRKEGRSYNQIAKVMHVSYSYVEAVVKRYEALEYGD